MTAITDKITRWALNKAGDKQWRYSVTVYETGAIMRLAKVSVRTSGGKDLFSVYMKYANERSTDYIETVLFKKLMRVIGAT